MKLSEITEWPFLFFLYSSVVKSIWRGPSSGLKQVVQMKCEKSYCFSYWWVCLKKTFSFIFVAATFGQLDVSIVDDKSAALLPCFEHSRNRFHECQFRTKTFPTNVHPPIFVKFRTKRWKFYLTITGDNAGFWYILKPYEVIITGISLKKLHFLRKLRPKRIDRIDSRVKLFQMNAAVQYLHELAGVVPEDQVSC
jgi:hypothetical protein